jgi:hypothetical protein
METNVMFTRSMRRVLASTVAAVSVLGTAIGPPVVAAPAASRNLLERRLGDLWTTVLELPTPQNPFGSTDYCVELRRNRSGPQLVAPFAPFGVESVTCVVPPRTELFVTVYTTECSTLEEPPYYGEDEAELRACARAADSEIAVTELAVDDVAVEPTEVETRLLRVRLPADNIFGLPARTRAESVGHGWVAALRPLSSGVHVITLHAEGTDVFGEPVDFTNTTTIIVTSRRSAAM